MQQINKYLVENLGTKEINILSSQDKELVQSFNLNYVSFDTNKHTVDLKVYDLNENYLETFYGIGDYTVEGTTVTGGPVQITVDPVSVLEARGYLGDVIVEFDAFNNLFSPRKSADPQAELFISEISTDRTEIRAKSTTISDTVLKNYANLLYSRLNDRPYFSEVYLRFLDQRVDVACINVITEVVGTDFYVTFKLYEPLPNVVAAKSIFSVVELIGEPTRFRVTREVEVVEDAVPHLKGPNFEIDIEQQRTLTSGYYTLQDLFSYPVSSSRYDLLSLYRENSAELGLDFTDFSSFVHFSSAEERLENFRYKLELIFSYDNAIAALEISAPLSLEIKRYRELKEGVLANFDPYERFLYFTNDPKAWPKSNTTKPYVNVDPAETRTEGTSAYVWWENIISEAQRYDEENVNALVNAIPEDVKVDENNNALLAFTYMVGQHFDEQWAYAKALADRYDTDNRLDYGISKDLVKDALKGFGLTLQESTQNLTNLFDLCDISGEYNTGSEASVTTFKRISVGAPIQISSGSQTIGSLVVNGNTAETSGTVDGSLVGSVQLRLNATVSGTLVCEASGTFVGTYNSSSYSGSLVGNVSGSLEGQLTDTFLQGQISASVSGTLSGSLYNGTVISGGPSNFRVIPGTEDVQPVSLENYRREIYKRIYHNLPHLIKTKGTERGLRALINCFGIPDDILEIRVLGNVDPSSVRYVGPESSTTSSLDRVRIASVESAPIYSNSFESCSTLSNYTRTRKLVQTHSDSSHEVHVGFNVNKQVNKVFSDFLTSSSITYDSVIGDPGNVEENYGISFRNILEQAIEENRDTLKSLRSPSGIVRLVRYFDSMLFRAVQEFVPARVELQTGVVVEDNILHRNRYRGVKPSATEEHFEGELETGFITGSDSKALDYLVSPDWTDPNNSRIEVDDKYDGELSGSRYTVTDGELIKRNFWQGRLIDGNPFKHASQGRMRYLVNMKFLSLPQEARCNMTLESSYLGKVLNLYSLGSVRYTIDNGEWIDANVGSGEIDGGTTTDIGPFELDSKTATFTGTGETRTGTTPNLTQGYALIDYDSVEGKHVNQIVLDAWAAPINSTFIGWFKGQIQSTDYTPNVDSFISSYPRLIVTQDSAEDAYTARYVPITTITPLVSNPIVTNDLNGHVNIRFGSSRIPPGFYNKKYGIVVDGFRYEGAYNDAGEVNITIAQHGPVTIEKQGFTEMTINGRVFAPEDGLKYVISSTLLVEIPWLN